MSERALSWRELRRWWEFEGVLSRRAFVPFVGFWLLACSVAVLAIAGWVPWLQPGEGRLPWAAWVPLTVLWVALYGGASRRWRDMGWPQWLLFWVWLVVAIFAGVRGALVLSLVLAVVPREGWFDRLAEIELGVPRARVAVRPVRVGAGSGVVVSGDGSVAPAPAVAEPVVSAEPLESVDEMREWLYGGGDEE